MPRGQPATSEVRRLAWVRLVFFVFFVVITFKLFDLQVLNYGLYAGLAAGQHDTLARLVPERGSIAVQDPLSEQKTYPVAVNQPLNFVFASPQKVTSAKAAAEVLAPILGEPAIDLAEVLSKTNDPWEALKHGLTDDQAAAVRNLNLPGISVAPELTRFYTTGPLMSQLLGFVGFNGNQRVGQYGVEGY